MRTYADRHGHEFDGTGEDKRCMARTRMACGYFLESRYSQQVSKFDGKRDAPQLLTVGRPHGGDSFS